METTTIIAIILLFVGTVLVDIACCIAASISDREAEENGQTNRDTKRNK